MDTKLCSTCRHVKPIAEFNKKSSTKDGLERYCKECHRARNRRHYQANKQAYVDTAVKWQNEKRQWWAEYKQTLSCSVCGENRYWCLDFHHSDPSEKENTVSQMVTQNASRERILEEVAKCVVVCRNCHADIHHHEKNGPLV